MFLRVVAVTILFCLPHMVVAQNAVQQSNTGVYGEALSNDVDERSLDDILEGGIPNELILVSARAIDVSPDDGSWMTVESDSGIVVRVVMKGHSFSVPSSLIGKEVLIYGRLLRHVITEDDRKHIAQEHGATQTEIDSISGDAIEYLLTATGVSER